ncbi:MAG: hypothetical protein IJY06_03425, partial [Oscillospiraceae bacterium]|nr:hypothetical protein [Oscillospiraceae bacterium]
MIERRNAFRCQAESISFKEKITFVGSVDTKIIRRFSSRNFMQTRRKGAGRLSPVKPFQRRMREILPKRCV